MREYLRRADLWWAKTYDAEVTTPPDIADELKELLAELAPASFKAIEGQGTYGGAVLDYFKI